MLDKVDKELLKITAELHSIPVGAYNIRKNGESVSRNSTANITISTKSDKSGIDITIKPKTRNEAVHIPVIISASGVKDLVYNDFYVGEDSDITIIAGCGIHNDGIEVSNHTGIHRFFLEKNSKVKYIEKHFAYGANPQKNMDPTTEVYQKENSVFVMDTTQISGIGASNRTTIAKLEKNAKLDISEKIMTESSQLAKTNFEVELLGEDSSCHIVSRAVARGKSHQEYSSKMNGKNRTFGHTECDAIVMDNATVFALPEVNAYSSNATLIHEAAIGKIAGEQIIKLMTLGLTEKEAEEKIIQGFLK